MSKKNHNNNVQTNTTNVENVVVPDEVNVTEQGVTPEEGVNSIDETEETTEVVNEPVEPVEPEVSVAETQESEENEKEDSSATLLNETNTEEVKNEEHTNIPPVTPAVTDVEPEEKDEQPELEQVAPTNEEAFFVSLGVITEERMDVVKERLKKAGFKSASMLEDVMVVGPFTSEVECIKARKAIVGKGLKCKIIQR